MLLYAGFKVTVLEAGVRHIKIKPMAYYGYPFDGYERYIKLYLSKDDNKKSDDKQPSQVDTSDASDIELYLTLVIISMSLTAVAVRRRASRHQN